MSRWWAEFKYDWSEADTVEQFAFITTMIVLSGLCVASLVFIFGVWFM